MVSRRGDRITGALITNDFGAAMWLTITWLSLAGMASLLIALRSRGGRVLTVTRFEVDNGPTCGCTWSRARPPRRGRFAIRSISAR